MIRPEPDFYRALAIWTPIMVVLWSVLFYEVYMLWPVIRVVRF